jgi:hypothetical protein
MSRTHRLPTLGASIHISFFNELAYWHLDINAITGKTFKQFKIFNKEVAKEFFGLEKEEIDLLLRKDNNIKDMKFIISSLIQDIPVAEILEKLSKKRTRKRTKRGAQ